MPLAVAIVPQQPYPEKPGGIVVSLEENDGDHRRPFHLGVDLQLAAGAEPTPAFLHPYATWLFVLNRTTRIVMRRMRKKIGLEVRLT